MSNEVIFVAGGGKLVCARTGGAAFWEVAVGSEARRWPVVKLAYVEVKPWLVDMLGRGAIERGKGAKLFCP